MDSTKLKEIIMNNKETLEEAADKKITEIGYKSDKQYYKLFDLIEFGAKWQAERMYSEEEVMEMFHNLSMHLPLHYEFLVKEQFKK
jgi:hypothetical protein